MRRSVARIKGLGFIVWHTRHHAYHLLIGVTWAWVLREVWHEFQPRWIMLSLIASELPDVDHVAYFLTYGKHDPYSKLVKSLFANRQWRLLWYTLDKGHKQNTNLATHNYFTILALFGLSLVAYTFEWQSSVIFLGAMVLHYLFDIVDDLLMLGRINDNWKRWGRHQ